jgi:hypothetical protein
VKCICASWSKCFWHRLILLHWNVDHKAWIFRTCCVIFYSKIKHLICKIVVQKYISWFCMGNKCNTEGAVVNMIICNYKCIYAISAYHWLTLWVWIPLRWGVLNQYNIKVCQWLAAGMWFSPGPPASSTNKTDLHDNPNPNTEGKLSNFFLLHVHMNEMKTHF